MYSPDSQRAIRAPLKKVHCRVLKKNPLKNLRIMKKLNPYEKTMCQNSVLHQVISHKIEMKKAAVIQPVKSDEKELERRGMEARRLCD